MAPRLVNAQQINDVLSAEWTAYDVTVQIFGPEQAALYHRDDRPQKVATERMLWRRNGSLCAAVGHEYAEEDEPLLITEREWLEAVST